MPAAREVLARRLAFQAAGCFALGSAFYGALLESAVVDLEEEGPVWRVLDGFEGESGSAAIALRLMGAVHRIVLSGKAPDLARHYPTTGGDGDAAAAWPVLRNLLEHRRDEIRRLVGRPRPTRSDAAPHCSEGSWRRRIARTFRCESWKLVRARV